MEVWLEPSLVGSSAAEHIAPADFSLRGTMDI
jgi:hypothetical protein